MEFRAALFTLLVYTIGCVVPQNIYCGWPGKPLNGKVRRLLLDSKAVGADLTPDDKFMAGSVVGYYCHDGRMDLLQGESTRMCQPDGRWSGERPWCDINVAFGKPVKYSGVMETTTETLTDGLSDSNDPVKTAQCPVLAKVNPYFEIDLLDSYPIHFVAIYGKDGTIGNMEQKILQMDTTKCVERTMNKTSLLYECARENNQIDPRAAVGRRIRFEHSDPFSVAVCEVVVYVNPSLSDCGQPEIPANGRVTIANFSSYQEARYECNLGYDISGTSTRKCYGRKWIGFQPLCIENDMTTTQQTESTTVPNGNDGGNKSMSVLEVALIVICVSLVTVLIVGFVCWLCNRYNCCTKLRCKKEKKLPQNEKKSEPVGNKKRFSWRMSSDYRKVNPPTESAVVFTNPAPTTIPASTENQTDLSAEQQTELQLAASDQNIYANVIRNDQPLPSPTGIVGMEAGSKRSSINYSPVYSKMIEIREKKALSEPGSPVPSVDEGIEEAKECPVPMNRTDGAGGSVESSASSSRKSYIPRQYRHTSPELQRQQKLLNDHLKDILKQKESPTATHETDF